MSTFIPCRICVKRKGPFPGYYYHIFNSSIKTVVECDCHKKWRQEEELNRKLKNANLLVNSLYTPLKDYRGNQSRDNIPLVINYVEKFQKFKDKMIYFYGPNGTQKTTIAMWIGKELIIRGFSAYYTTMENLVSILTPDFSIKELEDTKEYMQKKLIDVDLLIIDESFDKRSTTIFKSGFQIPLISSFLKNRFELEKKAILFVSNVPPHQIAQNGFGEVIQSLVMRNVQESTLTWLDTFVLEANVIDPTALFKR